MVADSTYNHHQSISPTLHVCSLAGSDCLNFLLHKLHFVTLQFLLYTINSFISNNGHRKIKIPFFCKILRNNEYSAKVLPKRSHLNCNTTGFQKTFSTELGRGLREWRPKKYVFHSIVSLFILICHVYVNCCSILKSVEFSMSEGESGKERVVCLNNCVTNSLHGWGGTFCVHYT